MYACMREYKHLHSSVPGFLLPHVGFFFIFFFAISCVSLSKNSCSACFSCFYFYFYFYTPFGLSVDVWFGVGSLHWMTMNGSRPCLDGWLAVGNTFSLGLFTLLNVAQPWKCCSFSKQKKKKNSIFVFAHCVVRVHEVVKIHTEKTELKIVDSF